MSLKKKTEPITGIPNDTESKLLVQKSRPLTWLWRSGLTLAEFKILDIYLSRINSHNSENRTVVISKGELEKALDVVKIDRDDLAKRITHLSYPIDLESGNKEKIHLVGLFEEAECNQDEKGIWEVRLTCTTAAMKYIFNVEKLGYLRYKLRSIIHISSRYTYILFIYLEQNRYRGSWEIGLDELRKLIGCETDSLYNEYRRFNDKILKRAQKELNEKTECRFTYEPIRKGRSISALRFTLASLSKNLENELAGKFQEQQNLIESQDTVKQTIRDERAVKFGIGFEDSLLDEFSDEEIAEFKTLAQPHISQDRIQNHREVLGNMQDALNYTIAEYICQKIQTMNVYASQSIIKNRYAYLKKAIMGKTKEKNN